MVEYLFLREVEQLEEKLAKRGVGAGEQGPGAWRKEAEDASRISLGAKLS